MLKLRTEMNAWVSARCTLLKAINLMLLNGNEIWSLYWETCNTTQETSEIMCDEHKDLSQLRIAKCLKNQGEKSK